MLLKHIKNDKEVLFYQERLKELSRLLTGVTLETELAKGGGRNLPMARKFCRIWGFDAS